MKRTSIISIFLFLSVVSEAQTILKGKALRSQLDSITNLISREEWESALMVFRSDRQLVLEKHVSRRQLPQYSQMKDLLEERGRIFEIMKHTVDSFENLYYAKEYCELTRILDLKSAQNAMDSQTWATFIELQEEAKGVFGQCQLSHQEVLSAIESATDGKIEPAIELLNHLPDPVYAFTEDKRALDKLAVALEKERQEYIEIRDRYILTPRNLLMAQVSSQTPHEKLTRLIAEVEGYTVSQEESKKIGLAFPKLLLRIDSVKQLLLLRRAELSRIESISRPPDYSKVDYSISRPMYFLDLKEGIDVGGIHYPQHSCDCLPQVSEHIYRWLVKHYGLQIRERSTLIEAEEFLWEYGEKSRETYNSFYRRIDKNGVLVEEKWFNADYPIKYEFHNRTVVASNEGFDFATMKFSGDGEFLELKNYEMVWAGGKRQSKLVSTVDKATRFPVELESYDKLVFRFDNKGRLVSVATINKDSGKKVSTVVLNWAKNSLTCQFPDFYSGRILTQKVFSFNDDGQMLKETLMERSSEQEAYNETRRVTYKYAGNRIQSQTEHIRKRDVGRLVPVRTIEFKYSNW